MRRARTGWAPRGGGCLIGAMKILVLGGTAWLGREVARQAVQRGHEVTCLARGESGGVAEGATLVAADRSEPGAYDALLDREWDAVVEVSWQPGFVRGALAALGARSQALGLRLLRQRLRLPRHARGRRVRAAAGPDRPGDGRSRALRRGQGRLRAGVDRRRRRPAAHREGGPDRRPRRLSDRSGYWVARAARDQHAPMLVPDCPDAAHPGDRRAGPRGLAARLRGSRRPPASSTPSGRTCRSASGSSCSRRSAGTPARSSPPTRRGSRPTASRSTWGRSRCRVARRPRLGRLVGPQRGRCGRRGLRHRPHAELIADTLVWEREQGLDRDRKAGLSAGRERELLAALASPAPN